MEDGIRTEGHHDDYDNEPDKSDQASLVTGRGPASSMIRPNYVHFLDYIVDERAVLTEDDADLRRKR
jgi:hypothetical protein